ncbi:ABC transporter permease [candidate division KSB1 bacterium]|nr:ABC transporter permease [candidate division KSB1 bacterium]
MIRHNLLIVFRNFKRNKSSFLINLIGLSTGLACALLIYLWVNDELHMDKFHEKDKRLYQVMLNTAMPTGFHTSESTPGLLAQTLAEEMPEVEYAAAVIPADWGFGTEGILSFENLQLKTNEQFVSQDYFHMFSYRLLQGNSDQVLFDKNSILISDEIARKLFGSTENVVGKTIHWDREILNVKFAGFYKISGVFEKPPSSSSDQFDLIFNYQLFFEKWGEPIKKWTNQNPYTYLVLKEGVNVEQFNRKIADFIKSKDKNAIDTVFIRPYSDKYLFDNYENGVQTGGRITYVRLFSLIALFILVIACINFMNLATAKASGRLKEVGVKKTVGAGRKALILQYLGESFAVVFMSLALAIVMVEFLLPQFNQLTGKQLGLVFDSNMVLTLLGISFFTGLMSGAYPAFFLSGFNPVAVLKGKLSTSLGELWARKGLVTFQFIISVLLIVSVLVVYKQIEFIQTTNLGINKENVICFQRDGNLEKHFDAFLPELKNIPGIVSASNSSGNFTGRHGGTVGGVTFDKDNQIHFAAMDINYDFFETLSIEIDEGRDFAEEFGSESSTIIFNETGIKVLAIDDPIGKIVQVWGQSRQIVGVVKDFNFESLYEEVKPCFFRILNPNFNFANNIWVKIQAGEERETIARIEKLYKEFNPGLPFEYRFLDADYQKLYEAEGRVALLSRYFAGLAVLISCLGLFGLAAFTAERRRKEMGIRKVLGSSGLRIVYLLSGDFTKVVLSSMLISLPVSYFISKHWLDSFAYRIDLQIWYFLGAGLVTLFVAWLTIASQAIRAAMANPMEALRYE